MAYFIIKHKYIKEPIQLILSATLREFATIVKAGFVPPLVEY